MQFIDATTRNENENATVTFDHPQYPYCNNMNCRCHFDVEHHDKVQHPKVSDEEMAQIMAFLSVEAV